MKEWEINIHYSGKPRTIKCTLEYKSQQIMRIRVQGNKTTLLLENDYPSIRFTKSKRGIKWKMREGKPDFAGKQTARLLIDILSELEYYIKKDFGELYPELPYL